MFLALWEYEVKPGCEERFEKVYGPEGDWAQPFRRDPHTILTRLVGEGFQKSRNQRSEGHFPVPGAQFKCIHAIPYPGLG